MTLALTLKMESPSPAKGPIRPVLSATAVSVISGVSLSSSARLAP